MQHRYCSHWNPSCMLIIFTIYVQSWPQKPKECCKASLKFYYLQRLCHYVFSVFTSWWFLWAFMWRYTQIRFSDRGNQNVWPKSELNQFSSPQDLIQAFVVQKLLVSHWSQHSEFAVLPCAALKIVWLPETGKDVCVKEISSRSRRTFNPQRFVIFKKMYLVIKNKWKYMMKTMY